MTKLLMAMISLLSPSNLYAFDMNPIDVNCWGSVLLCKATGISEKMKFPVHETITLLAYDYYLTPDASTGGAARTSADTLKKTGVLRDLVLGSEWNDDPDSLLRQGITKAAHWYALFNDAKLRAKCKKKPGPECDGKETIQNPMMLYRSHFGDLQFLHSMASFDDETARITKEKMMAWARFTYGIYIAGGDIDKQDINDMNNNSFVSIAKIIDKPGWTIGALFDPLPGGEWKHPLSPFKLGRYEPNGKLREQRKYEQDDDEISVKYIALGSLLHMVQDSYSDSHTLRINGCNPIVRSKGGIIAFRNYVNQKSDDHAIADANPAWLENGELKKDNPLWATAQLINFAFNNVPWEDGVEKFLDEEVFPLIDPQAKPQPGNRKCFEGRS